VAVALLAVAGRAVGTVQLLSGRQLLIAGGRNRWGSTLPRGLSPGPEQETDGEKEAYQDEQARDQRSAARTVPFLNHRRLLPEGASLSASSRPLAGVAAEEQLPCRERRTPRLEYISMWICYLGPFPPSGATGSGPNPHTHEGSGVRIRSDGRRSTS